MEEAVCARYSPGGKIGFPTSSQREARGYSLRGSSCGLRLLPSKKVTRRVPYPTDATRFRALVQLGARLRRLHLLEDPTVEQFITKFPAPGDNTVSRKMTAKSPGFEPTGKGLGKVWINDDQYFADVPEVAWNFYIGGYQPAQKWLKDRVGRQLTFDDIRHYQRMIVALTATGRCMEEVDKVGVV
ncbi:MAG: hypothetical protein IPM68_04675 [Flavobacteriales bacterium]|nr:hypothetical protein [Flavobacteriales bacterium]